MIEDRWNDEALNRIVRTRGELTQPHRQAVEVPAQGEPGTADRLRTPAWKLDISENAARFDTPECTCGHCPSCQSRGIQPPEEASDYTRILERIHQRNIDPGHPATDVRQAEAPIIRQTESEEELEERRMLSLVNQRTFRTEQRSWRQQERLWGLRPTGDYRLSTQPPLRPPVHDGPQPQPPVNRYRDEEGVSYSAQEQAPVNRHPAELISPAASGGESSMYNRFGQSGPTYQSSRWMDRVA